MFLAHYQSQLNNRPPIPQTKQIKKKRKKEGEERKDIIIKKKIRFQSTNRDGFYVAMQYSVLELREKALRH